MATVSAVRKANKASSSQLASSVDINLHSSYDFKTIHAAELLDDERRAIWALIESNMRDLYQQSSFGWDPPAKQKELFHRLSRFILAYTDGKLVAYAMFRFEYEDLESVLYCYELQVSRGCQRTGMGGTIMRWLENLGTVWGMEKVMLTVFKVNESAVNFYQEHGFKIDPSSPGYLEEGDNPADVEDSDYEILSRELK